MEHYSTMKKEVLPFATTRVKLEALCSKGINQTEKDKYCMVSPMWNLKERSQTHRNSELNGICQS